MGLCPPGVSLWMSICNIQCIPVLTLLPLSKLEIKYDLFECCWHCCCGQGVIYSHYGLETQKSKARLTTLFRNQISSIWVEYISRLKQNWELSCARASNQQTCLLSASLLRSLITASWFLYRYLKTFRNSVGFLPEAAFHFRPAPSSCLLLVWEL